MVDLLLDLDDELFASLRERADARGLTIERTVRAALYERAGWPVPVDDDVARLGGSTNMRLDLRR